MSVWCCNLGLLEGTLGLFLAYNAAGRTYHAQAAKDLTDSLLPDSEVKKQACRQAGQEPLQWSNTRMEREK